MNSGLFTGGRKLKIAGLSIEGDTLRASIVYKRFGAIKQLKREDISLPKDEKIRQDAVNDALKKWKLDFGITGIAVGLDFGYFTYHFIDLPVTSKTDITQALSFEMAKFLPLPEGEYIRDFYITETTKIGTRNLVLCIRKDKLGWVERCIIETKLKLLCIRCSGMEVLIEFAAKEIAPNSILLLEGQSAYYSFELKDKSLTAIKAVSLDKASSEIERLAKTSEGGIYAVGSEYFAKFGNLDIKMLSYFVPYLVAKSAFRKGAIDLNFIPVHLGSRVSACYTYTPAFLAAVSLLIYFLTSPLAYYKELYVLDEIRTRIEKIRSVYGGLDETRKQLDIIGEKVSFLNEFKKNRNRQIQILETLSILLPKGAWLTSFHSDNQGKVEIEGFARRTAEIIGPLEKSSLFRNVEFTSPVTIRNGKERFSIRMWVQDE